MECNRARARLKAVDAAMHAQQQDLDRAYNRMRNLRRTEQRLRRYILDVCFILYVWCAPAESLALAYAAHATDTKKCDAKVRPAELEERYLQTDLEVLRAISSRTGGISKRALAEAARFQSQHTLFQWIQDQNDRKGVAPNTTMVRQHLAQISDEPVATAAPSSAACSQVVSVSWVQRFRKRWALKRGKFMPGERLTPDLIATKVTLSI